MSFCRASLVDRLNADFASCLAFPIGSSSPLYVVPSFVVVPFMPRLQYNDVTPTSLFHVICLSSSMSLIHTNI